MHTTARPTALAGALIAAGLGLAACAAPGAAGNGHVLDGLSNALVAGGTCTSTPTAQEQLDSPNVDRDAAQRALADFASDGHTELRICVYGQDASDSDVVLEAFSSRADLLARADAMVQVGARHYIWMSSADAKQQWLIDGSDRAADDLTAIAPRFGGSKVEPDGHGGFVRDSANAP